MSKPCTYCHKDGHTAFLCPQKPRKRIETTKPMKKMGKVAKKWKETRRVYMGSDEVWSCVIGGARLTRETVTIDHIISRGRDPSKRYELDNLQPLCYFHNQEKGSLSMEQYLAKKPDTRCSNY